MNTATIDLDEQADQLTIPRRPATWLFNGFYTLSFPDGSHKTFRIRTERGGTFAGRRTLALLVGPENTSEYETLAFVGEDGFTVWKRYRDTKTMQYVGILWELARGDELDGYELRVSKRCRICNRPLTTPESIAAGIGPGCAARGGT